MARRRKKGGRRRRKIPIIATAGMVIGLKALYDAYKGGGYINAFEKLTGYNLTSGTWNWRVASAGTAMVGGAAGSMIVSKLGLRRHVNIPWFTL